MRKAKSFWTACESLPGLAAVESEWRQRAGADYDVWKPFLHPRQELASSIPCRDARSCGCVHQVIKHGNGDCVAVCTCEPPTCRTFPVTRSELVVYELDMPKLGLAIGKALSLYVMDSEVDGIRKTRLVGTDSPSKGYEFPVYLTLQYDSEEFQKVVFALTAMHGKSFILIAPTVRWLTSSCRSLMESKGSLFLTIPDVITPVEGGRYGSNTIGTELVDAFHKCILPNIEGSVPKRFFKTPAGATWENVHISFVFGDKVSVKVKSETAILNCADMGMCDKRNGNPTVQWDLLYAFAQQHGILDWQHTSASRKNQKRRENLARDLKQFFRISDDPIEYVEEIKGWRTRFHIYPE